MSRIRKFSWRLLTLFNFVFCVANAKADFEKNQCCPPNSYIIQKSGNCTGIDTGISLKCEEGYWFVDGTEPHSFEVIPNGSLILIYDGDKYTEFCLGRMAHLNETSSNLSVALCFYGKALESNGSSVISMIKNVALAISVLFLLLTLYIYLVLPNLRDLQGKCVIAFICSLIASYTLLDVMNIFTESSFLTCNVEAGLLYFFMSSSFFWNNVITFTVWKAIRKINIGNLNEKSWMMIYIFWGFGIPFLMVAIAFILDHVPGESHIRPHFGEVSCWFKEEIQHWSYFYGPITLLLILNSLMFTHSCWTLWKSYRGSTVPSIRSLKFKCILYLKLFLLCGITWIFEVISYASLRISENPIHFWVFTDLINGLQGVLIFLILVAFRQKVRRGLVQKKLFGIKWPESWLKEEVQESSTSFFGDELELAKQKVKMIETQNENNFE